MPKELIKIKLPVDNLFDLMMGYDGFEILSIGSSIFEDINCGCHTLVIDKTEKIIYVE